MQVFNLSLNAGLGSIGFDIIIPVNVMGLINEVLANPSQYGFTNTTGVACTSVVGGSVSSLACTPNTPVSANAPTTCMFAAGVHPTTALQKIAAQYMVSIIQAPEQIGLLAKAPMAISAAQGRLIEAGRRRPPLRVPRWRSTAAPSSARPTSTRPARRSARKAT